MARKSKKAAGKAAKPPSPPTGVVYELRQDTVHSFPGWQKADAQSIGRSLAEIASANQGRLRPRTIVETVRRQPSHPLYKHFDWDRDKAAMQHWCDVARSIVRAIVLVEPDADDGAPPKRAWMSADDRDGISYHSIDQILRETDLRLAVMRRAERELAAFQLRYSQIREILEFIKAARSILSSRLAERTPPEGDDDRPTA